MCHVYNIIITVGELHCNQTYVQTTAFMLQCHVQFVSEHKDVLVWSLVYSPVVTSLHTIRSLCGSTEQ